MNVQSVCRTQFSNSAGNQHSFHAELWFTDLCVRRDSELTFCGQCQPAIESLEALYPLDVDEGDDALSEVHPGLCHDCICQVDQQPAYCWEWDLRTLNTSLALSKSKTALLCNHKISRHNVYSVCELRKSRYLLSEECKQAVSLNVRIQLIVLLITCQLWASLKSSKHRALLKLFERSN